MDQAYVMPKYLTGVDIRHARQSLGMTQKEFAQFAGCALRKVENWETKAEKITGPVVTLFLAEGGGQASVLKQHSRNWRNICPGESRTACKTPRTKTDNY